jgi:hypothetical protein
MGILLIGVLSIMSLVPVAIHQVATASDNTLGAAVGQNVIVSLQNGQVDMGDYYDIYDPLATPPDTTVDYLFNELYRTDEVELYSDNSPPLADTSLQSYDNWPAAIWAIHRNEIDNGGTGFGNMGAGRRTFQIPGDTGVFTVETWNDMVPDSRFVGSGHPELVPVPWAQDYYWSATFLPIPADDDEDGSVDEDVYGDEDGDTDPDDDADGLIDEDDLIMPSTDYRVQVAVWRVVNPSADLLLYDSGDGRAATWTDGSAEITGLSGGTLARANQYDYIRLDSYGVWYRIARYDVENTPNTVELVTEFRHPDGGTFTGPISVASDFKLIGLYDAVVESSELGGAP